MLGLSKSDTAACLPGAPHFARVAYAQASACRKLDDLAYEVHARGLIRTGGTTLLVHVLSATEVYTAAVGDCKALISAKGAPEALNTCHNPDQASERERFAAAGIQVSPGWGWGVKGEGGSS